ncbi:GH36-type glycosyl hydrolase domain-containing protein [Phenylobacterium sp.]|uniref:GH36-type glycosyl hydrolase domain-containing protein n=1 Tax=Phenylobacterium sp. TaxID=1871053 RepID=UPI00286A5E9A|nr:glucoamylase family protein [Phenylobacterium sp.]
MLLRRGPDLTTPFRGLLGGAHPRAPWDDGAPIRAELFGAERLEEHARSLAAAQEVTVPVVRGAILSKRLADDEAVLLAAYRDVAGAIDAGAEITPAAEWLIDNFHVVEKQIREVRGDLPPGYYRQLPKLAGGPFAGYPRVFGVAWAFVAHTDSLFDPEILCRYLRAYQEVQPLTIGELWAVAITLRIVLIENLRRIAQRIMDSRAGRRAADALADRVLGAGGRAAEPAQSVLYPQPQTTFPDAFLVQLVHRLRDQDPRIAPALEWLDDQLARQGTTADAVVRDEHQRQVSGSVTVRNIITSMRLISNVDWTELFERISLVDEVFKAGSPFADMDFPTRNLYRNAVEQLARGSHLSELAVAHAAVAMAGRARDTDGPGGDPRRHDPGYALIAGGRAEFEAEIGFRPPAHSMPGRVYRALGIGGYVGVGALVAAGLLAIPLFIAAASGLNALWLLALAILGLIPAVDLAVAIVNRVVTQGFHATLLPAMALRGGITPDLRTLVTVPTLLTSLPEIEELISRLEIHYLASPEGDLHFALLSDWADAASEQQDGDEELLEAAQEGIARLNRRYAATASGARFLLLHRRRVWNRGEGRWIGWERKRGKLSELNRLLRGAQDTTFLAPPPVPSKVRFVITLDSDTRLPRETVGRLIGKMAHPLNRPRIDPVLGRVVEGYAVLQPRVTPALPVGREGSLFLRVFSNASGIDPYAAAVSDVYQDLFGEGSYTGKGIYDLDAFEAALKGRVPESALLSHDLFEGVFARSGLASDVEVVEEFPTRYDVAARRHHRWARGDWQLLPWILGAGPRGGLPAIGRWKMLDNVRRSLSAPALVTALVAGWALPLRDAVAWTVFIVLTMALPPLIPVIAEIVPRRPGVSLPSHYRALAGELRFALIQLGLMIVFLADQAWLMSDAILRTLVRLTLTRRHLLEWVPAAQAAAVPAPGLLQFYRSMPGAPIIATAAVAVAWAGGQGAWPLAAAFALAWVISPAAALWASLSPRVAGRRALDQADTRALRLIARRTWRFFDVFVTPDDNMLPPDNFQETPEPVVAHRTSPTNIGLYLLAVASARDFAWIGTLEAVERLEATLATVARLPKHRGHLYNWYDTRDLRPLDPPYISSVDSGNLAGHLIAVAHACRDWRGQGLSLEQRLQGASDGLDLVRDEARRLREARKSPAVSWRRLEDQIERLSGELLRAGAAEPQAALARISEQAAILADAVGEIALQEEDQTGADLQFWADAVRNGIEGHRRDAAEPPSGPLDARLLNLARTAHALAMAMEFGFLIDPDRLLLSIGYQTSEAALDPSCYDLLASEARLASFIAIAKGDAPARHWFRLGRAVTPVASGAALISWSGSMFEYLMPSIVMRAPADSLIEQTNRLIVGRQIEYGGRLNAPWGVSESAYNARDLDFTYQYSNFGVPGLGLKRGLADSAVVAPYATALASMIDPQAAVRNFERLEALGAQGQYGFYEALDFTPARVPDGEPVALVRAFMAHHQGMTIAGIADTLLDGLMRSRFHAEPMVQATELLLQERAPREVIAAPPLVSETTSAARVREIEGPAAWRNTSPHGATPATQLLSNGRYSVMLTAAGSGYSTWGDLAVTRWRDDATCDDWGAYIYLRDAASGEVWTATYQAAGTEPDAYAVTFNEDRAEFTRRDGDVSTNLQVLVSAEDDAEVRRVTISNAGDRAREIEVTSYAELVLGPQSADVAHPAFSKMFIETEHLAGLGAIVARRRQRSPSEPQVWAAHLAVVDGETVGKREFETDRARFLSRGGSVRAPSSILTGRPLSGTTGPVLDPIFALRRRVRIAPGATARIDFWTMVASSREAVLDLVDKHHDVGAFKRAAALAWTQVQVQLHHLGVDRSDAGQYQRLAGHMIYAAQVLRPPSEVIGRGRGGQPGLWPLGISGDLPILLVRVEDVHQLGLVKEALQAVEYWRMKRLAVDLVILNERGSSYVQEFQTALETLVRASQSRPQIGDERPPGHTFMLRADLISPEARTLLGAVARVVLVGDRGRLVDQLERAPEAGPPRRVPPRRPLATSQLQVPRPAPGMEFFNGLGGFAEDGREYVTTLGPGQSTPAPWINVVANAGFGFQVSAEGGGYAWSVNSRERQLTPWCNDPVTDRPGQALYLRDEQTGDLWSPTALPIRDEAGTYVARHGWGYSRFEHTSHGIAAELLEYVPLADPIKISRLRLRNLSGRTRRLSVTAYVEWALGPSRTAGAPFISTRIDPDNGALLANNPWNPAFGDRVAFVDLAGRQTSWTGDRREFIGRNGALAWPAALANEGALSGRVGSGLDPCAALQTTLEIAPYGVAEIDVFLGDTPDEAAACALIARYRDTDLDAVLSEVRSFWSEVVGSVQVKTPDRSMDIMLNGWLTYQTLACRVWARSGFYQASGAYGFRDQLQDGMALASVRPSLTREHLLRASGRQFLEGDVQHWWLPHSGQGVRTRISDDRAWLAYATAHYVTVTGDVAVLDELTPFLDGPALDPGESDSFFLPTVLPGNGSLYEHCARALDASLMVGRHGLPLIGGGDWNDGMNRVGVGGKGESVWLGWLLHTALGAFTPIAEARGDQARVARWTAHAKALRAALEREAWDGHWYLRGWFDDGSALGSATSEECRIDSIAQSWAVLSGVGRPDRAALAMDAVDRELILPHDRLALLFTPPFDRSHRDPGYIKGYPPGLRENGGQYTHAALWSVMAFAGLGEGDKAAALFGLLNPINNARTRTDMHRYKVEPYVAAADVYAAAGHVGRGGWTWYTGSAGWMQRAGVESILGLRVAGGALHIDPCIPGSWPRYEITLRHGASRYAVVVENPQGVQRGIASAELDGVTIPGRPLSIPLVDDGVAHRVTVRLG